MHELLDRLCERYGVLPAYHDIWGQPHHASEAAKRALLEAMGVAAADDAAVAASLEAAEAQAWERGLPPVLVVREGSTPYRVAVTLPESVAEAGWRLLLENEGEVSGRFAPPALDELARRERDGQTRVCRQLLLDLPAEAGYHRLFLETAGGCEEMAFIVTPSTCYLPPALHGEGRSWGFAAQLYAVRSERNWGMGDFGDLRRILEFCAEEGAGTVLLNPLHALFPDAPEHASPYSPSHRAGFNTLYLEVEAIADYGECGEAQALVHAPAFQARLRALRGAGQVDYRGVAELKHRVLALLHAHFRARHLGQNSERARAFHAFRAERGDSLERQALFEALQEHFRAEDAGIWGWPAWPAAYRDVDAAEVAAFRESRQERIEYFAYLQWLAATQLAAAGTRSWECGLGIGIMLDLAIGVAEGGAATWTRREIYALGASTGAPPDEINRMGQDWGLPPLIPHRLTASAYAPFIEILRANMRDAGALRMDHVMGLFRLFWVARGLPAAEGAYVSYPSADLLGILALESQRNRCLVLGEDLGTVPDSVRATLYPMRVLSTRLLYFEREQDGRLQPPQAYPQQAAAAVTSHDLPTLAGYWQGSDIDLRENLHLYPDPAIRDQQVVMRSRDRAQLLLALEHEGVLPAGAGLQPVAFPEMTAALSAAVYTYLARAPAQLLLVQMEDAFGVVEQPNLPGTTEPTYPCWRLKLPLNLEAWPTSPWLQPLVQSLRRERPVSTLPAHNGAAEGVRLWIPRATYRLQLHQDFNLRQATALLPYLDELGVSHTYLSPLLKARAGSRHGYDISDHSRLNPEIAAAEDFEQFAASLKRHGMGLIMDLVPNHMGIMGADNGWWLDVLENGPASRYAGYFDIDWDPLDANLRGRVLLPILGDHYGTVLENGQLRLEFDPETGSFSVFYYQHRFPLDPREYPRILNHGSDRLATDALPEFRSLATAFGHLPARDALDPEAVAERVRDKEILKRQLATLYVSSPAIAQFLQENLAEFNGAAAGADFTLLHDLMQAQAWRLACWRVAADEINYRRFFDINDLAALRMDNPEVFAATHRLVRELLARGYVHGLRIDHCDGLYDPCQYFQRVQAMAAALAQVPTERPLYLVAEKILAAHEHLPESWPIHGTTGYDFAAACTGLFVAAGNEDRCTRIYQSFIHSRPRLEDLLRENKHLIMETSLAGELQVLATQLTRLAKSDRRTRDYSFNSLRGALAEIVAAFPVYRTYVAQGAATAEDARSVDWAVGVAKKHSRAADTRIFDFVREILLARTEEAAACAMKFQQYSSPVMARAVEDTTFYQYNRLLCLNEVGSDPRRFGLSLAAFHRENQERARRWPHAMLASSSHDSKRSEDVRARLVVLSQLPDAWHQAISRWSKLNRGKRLKSAGDLAPSRNDEYFLYQTLLGVWPLADLDLADLASRVEDSLVKSAREAKQHTSWINPDADYEAALRQFTAALLSPEPGNLFLRDFLPFQQRIAHLGALTSLAQLLLKLTAPGVPDIYQGNEVWDFSLVDPDNRRPVDFAARRIALRRIQAARQRDGAAACAQALLAQYQDGGIKLYFTWKTLSLRRAHEALFREGDYLPIKAHGPRADQVCAYARRHQGEVLLLLVPREFGALLEETGTWPLATWVDTWVELPAEWATIGWHEQLCDTHLTPGEPGKLDLAQVFKRLPFALLWGRN